MPESRTVTTLSGKPVTYIDEIIGSGAMKDVYLTADHQEVVAFYRDPLDAAGIERLTMITGPYRKGIFDDATGAYWQALFCWPTDVVFDGKRHGIVLPVYAAHFFFTYGSVHDDFLDIKGGEKEGKWFASPTNRLTRLDPRERGDWRTYLRICLLISRAVRRMHAAGLAHSDLSYRNVLISPSTGHACLIDVDGLVVPGKFPPDVVGTPDFIAPEVVATAHLDRHSPHRILPSRLTDRHALAVLIYQYLLLRHPLRGRKIHDAGDPNRDETVMMGEKARFVEHPFDASNRPDPDQAKEAERFWQDVRKLPYRITGPYLSELFRRAFVEGLHDPEKRPTADEWERALIKTVDLLLPCADDACVSGWYVFDPAARPVCPFCKTPHPDALPVIHLYSERGEGAFIPDEHFIAVYRDLSIFPWHVDRRIVPNERLGDTQKQRVGYCLFHRETWRFVNETLEDLHDCTDPRDVRQIGIGEPVTLIDGLRLLVRIGETRRLLVVRTA